MKRRWFTKVNWSVRLAGSAELSAQTLKRARAVLRKGLRWSAHALLVLLMVPGAVQLNADRSTALKTTEQSGFQRDRVITTDIGEHRAETLPGGGQAVLNTATTLHAHSTPSEDQVSLERGEALFDNTQAGSKPVRVAAGAAAIEADRARFSVRQNTGGVFVATVFEGQVALAPGFYRSAAARGLTTAKRVRLSRGRSATIQPGRVRISSFEADDAPRLQAWTHGLVIFDGETLSEAVAEFNRYNIRQIVIVDDSVKRLRVGGAYRTTDPQGFARALEQVFGIRAASIPPGTERPGVIILSSPSLREARSKK
jgi:transmembrane sensor